MWVSPPQTYQRWNGQVWRKYHGQKYEISVNVFSIKRCYLEFTIVDVNYIGCVWPPPNIHLQTIHTDGISYTHFIDYIHFWSLKNNFFRRNHDFGYIEPLSISQLKLDQTGGGFQTLSPQGPLYLDQVHCLMVTFLNFDIYVAFNHILSPQGSP